MSTVKENILSADLIARIHNEIKEIIDKFIPFDTYTTVGLDDYLLVEMSGIVYLMVFDDIHASLEPKRKLTKNNLPTFDSFESVMYYRISNTLYYCKSINKELRVETALAISEEAKVKTGIFIHPAAKIGERFVIDYGVGTVIGDTCKIGDDCYMLQGVILGSKNIKDNISGKKDHPIIGKNVVIAAFARIVGDVKIGDDAVINPHCIITQDVPEKTEVVITNQLQLCTPPLKEKIKIYGIVPENGGIFSIYGTNFTNPSLSLVDENQEEIKEIECSIISNDAKFIKCKLSLKDKIDPKGFEKYQNIIKMKIKFKMDLIIITNSMGLNEAIKFLFLTNGV